MASGVKVADACLTAFQELKLRKAHKYIIFSLNSTSTEIIVEKKPERSASTENIVGKKSEISDYEAFLKDLPEDECKWAVYDFEFEKEAGKRNKLCFFSWSPDKAKIKAKMVFAASREALRRKLDGIAIEIQGTDSSEVEYETILAKVHSSTR